jgi:diguanylate cyclase (GGDEF)-like protein
MTPELDAQLRSLVNFPSPPGVATHIIELAQDPNIEMGKVARAIGMDPALAAKVLRIANSPLYAQRRRSENLRQSLIVLGLNATLTLALSFSLVKSLRGAKPNGVNHPLYWRRALLGASAARALGEATGQTLLEELFLAGLLQDIGMLALDKAIPDLYRDTAELQKSHRELAAHERKRIGVDHADVGVWLMKQWNLPERLSAAIGASHRLDNRRVVDPADGFNRCVTLSGGIVDIFLLEADKKPFQEVAQQLERVFGLDKEEFGRIIQRVSSLVPETEAIYETDLLGDPESIVEQAREVLMIRSLHAMQEMSQLRDTADTLTERARELEEEARRDPLTGVYNRSYLEHYLRQEFEQAERNDWPLSIAFCDLDGFKRVNDSFGHQAGDKVLKATAAILKNNVRRVDVVARYGGEEFVLVLPATDRDIARAVCERIVTAFQTTRHEIGQHPVAVTVSIGYATHGGRERFPNAEALVKAADQALYTAKLQGRNRTVRYEATERSPVVQFL